MPKFAANLTMLFPERPFLERFEAAAQAGFKAVEFLFPYAHSSDEIRARLRANGLQLVLHNLQAGRWEAGHRNLNALRNAQDEPGAGLQWPRLLSVGAGAVASRRLARSLTAQEGRLRPRPQR